MTLRKRSETVRCSGRFPISIDQFQQSVNITSDTISGRTVTVKNRCDDRRIIYEDIPQIREIDSEMLGKIVVERVLVLSEAIKKVNRGKSERRFELREFQVEVVR
jgi:hypothetical protein